MLDGVRILAVHHDPGLNGATLLFQTVLEGLAQDYGAAISISLPRPGPILARAQALGPVHIESAPPPRRTARQRLARRPRTGRPPTVELVFANSAASLGSSNPLVHDDETPLAVYVHESRYLLENAVDQAAMAHAMKRALVVFAVSDQVRETVEELFEPTGDILVVPGFVPVHGTTREHTPPTTEATSDLSGRAPVVGALGTMAWYKGPDLFVAVAHRVRQLLPDPEVRFVWVGDPWPLEVRTQVEHDVNHAGLQGVVQFPGRLDNPTDFLRSLALFLLPSREDSWPLVMLEAADAGVPIICFRDSGGAEQFVAAGGGTAVPYLDVEAMARAVVRYLSDPDLRTRDARIAREQARSHTAATQIRAIARGLAGLVGPRTAHEPRESR